MPLRVTPQHFAHNTVRFAQSHSAKLLDLQAQISSGLRIRKPSDDPGALGPLLANRASVTRIEIDLANIETSRSKLNQSVAQLLTAQDALTRANSLALEGVQGTAAERATYAAEIDGILEHMLQIANSTDGGKPIYAGTSDDLSPFRVASYNADGNIEAIEYFGTDERSRIIVGALITTDSLYAGNEIFMEDTRAETLYIGDTGAVAGTGTDSSRGRGRLTVTHTSTTILGGSGLQPGTSTSDDTLIGSHTLTVDSIAGTLQLNGGNIERFTPGDTDVQVIASGGARVSIDTSLLTPGFVGDVEVIGDGTLSLDGGVTVEPIVLSDNQALIHPTDGTVTNVNTNAIQREGTDEIEYIGTSGIFQALIDLRDDLLNTRDLSSSKWQESMDRRIGDIQRVHDHLLDVVGEQSIDLENLDALQFRAEDYRLKTREVISSVESADVTDAIVRMQQEQNSLQYTYAITAQLLQTSLMDFLR